MSDDDEDEYIFGVPYEDDEPTCDYCGHGEQSADWNPETGNHESCDYLYLIEKAIEQSV